MELLRLEGAEPHVAVINIDDDVGQDGAHELLVVPFLHHEELEPGRDELGERLLQRLKGDFPFYAAKRIKALLDELRQAPRGRPCRS